MTQPRAESKESAIAKEHMEYESSPTAGKPKEAPRRSRVRSQMFDINLASRGYKVSENLGEIAKTQFLVLRLPNSTQTP